MKKLTAVVLGYGMRGKAYAKFAIDNPDKLKIVGVADPNESNLEYAKKIHNLSNNQLFFDWKDISILPKMADFAVISMQDNMHYEPALAFIEKGYNLLLEKPMATTAKECKEISEAAEKKGVKVIVCHVLRFTKFWYKLKDIIDNGDIGDVMSIVHMENVGNIHQSHSYVRGNWRNSKESSPMILAKSCHDMDILQWLIGKECKQVQSFGSLTHFTHKNKPEGAPDYCYKDCPHAETCFYNAVRNYKKSCYRGVVANKVDPTDEEVMEGLKTGPYGRCVYDCDNDVVDHQVVNMEFDGGCTVSFTMNAFNRGGRFIRIFGTKGEITAAMAENAIEVYSFAMCDTIRYELEKIGEDIWAGHGGGDTGIMEDLVKYLNNEEPSKSICDIHTSYMNHVIAFAAEESRISNTVVDVKKYASEI